MDTTQYHPDKQTQRRHEFAAAVRRLLRPMLADDATAPNLLWWDQPRMAIFGSNAFFLGNDEEIAFANVILRYVRDIQGQLKTDAGPMPFETTGLASVLVGHEDKLESDTRQWAESTFRQILPFAMTADFQFQGFNDNMPVMFTWALLYGGQLFSDARATEIGRANLLQLRDLLRRRGTVSEYGAHYGTHRLTGIAQVVEHIQDTELAGIARDIEARLWAELAAHYHPRLGTLGGPSMRGGAPWDKKIPLLMRHVFGDAMLPPDREWMELLTHIPHEATVDLGLDPKAFTFAQPFCYGAEFTGATYHVPDPVAELFYDKSAGFQMRCTAEQGYVNEGVFCEQKPVYGQGGILITSELTSKEVVIPHFPENGAQAHGMTAYHGRNYLLGTSTTNQFQTSHPFRCTFARHAPPRHAADRGEVFVRYNVNEKTQGGRLENTYRKAPDQPEVKQGNYCTLIRDCGRHHTLQNGPTALCLQVPQPLEKWDIHSMRTDVLLYQPGGERTARIFVGDMPVEQLPFESDDDLITIDEGAVYLAIRPLIVRHRDRECALRIHAAQDYTVFSLYNYQGASIELSDREMVKLGNGFLFDVRDAGDYDSFEDFQAEVRETRVLDRLEHGTRRVHIGRPDARLSMEVCPYANTVKNRTINARPADCPQFEFSDGRHQNLPFLNDHPANGLEDWDWLETQLTRPLEDYNVQD